MAKQAQPFWLVGPVLESFKGFGCVVNVADPTVRMEDGDVINVRYLLHPPTKRYVPLVDLEDDFQIPEETLEHWERRLGITLPRPPYM